MVVISSYSSPHTNKINWTLNSLSNALKVCHSCHSVFLQRIPISKLKLLLQQPIVNGKQPRNYQVPDWYVRPRVDKNTLEEGGGIESDLGKYLYLF